MPPKKEMDEIKKSLDFLTEELNAMKELHKQPREISMTEDIGEIRKSLDFLSGETSAIKEQQKQLLHLMEEVKELRRQNAKKEERISDLERRVDELEQYSRVNDVVVTGLKVKLQSYAKAVANTGSEPDEQDTISVEHQVATLLQSRGITLDVDDIEACHLLPRRRDSDPPVVIMRFANRKKKIDLLKQGRKLKGTNVFMNDHLTRKNREIARKARILRKQGKVQSTWVRNCKIFIKLNGPPEEAKVLVVRSMEELAKHD